MNTRTIATIVACMLTCACAAPTGIPGDESTAIGGKADANPHEHVADSVLHFTEAGWRAHFTALPEAPLAVGYTWDEGGSFGPGHYEGQAMFRMWVDADELTATGSRMTGRPTMSLLIRLSHFEDDAEAVEYLRDYFAGNIYFRDLSIIDARANAGTNIEVKSLASLRAVCNYGAKKYEPISSGQCDRLFPQDGDHTYLHVSGTLVPEAFLATDGEQEEFLAAVYETFESPESTWAFELVDEDRLSDASIAIVGARVSFDVEDDPSIVDRVEPDLANTPAQMLPVQDTGAQLDLSRAVIQMASP